MFADLCPQGIVCVCMFLALGGREREGEGEKYMFSKGMVIYYVTDTIG